MTELALKGDARLPLYQRLADALREEVITGARKPGDRIPSENVLAGEHGIAAGTVRQALSQLVSEGMLERIRGRGTFVKRPDFKASLFRFFRFRSISGELVVPESRILDRAVKPLPHYVARKLKMNEGDPGIFMSRLRIVDEFPIVSEEIWLPQNLFSAFMDIPLSEIGDLLYPIYESQCGQLVVQADEELRADSADQETADLLQVDRPAMIMVIERLTKDYGGKPLEWRRSRGCAEQFHYHTEIR